jgi:hypothetical protein
MAFPFLGGIIKTFAKPVLKIVKKGAGAAIKGIRKVVKPSSLKKAAKVAVKAAATGAGISVVVGKRSPGIPDEQGLPPELGGGGAGGTARENEIFARGIAAGEMQAGGGSLAAGGGQLAGFRGGRGGLIGGLVASGALPLTSQVFSVRVARVPPGYVKVALPDGRVIGMLAQVAYSLGIKKRPSRGQGITGRELRAAKKVQRLIKRMTVGRKLKTPIKTAGRAR